MTDFSDLLQSAEQLASEFGRFHPADAVANDCGSHYDLPRVERNLRQLMDAGQQLFSKTSKGSGAGIHLGSQDVKASVLLGSKGVDLPTMTNALESLAATASQGTGFEPVEAVRSTDVAGFLKGERENAILSVIEETRKDTFESAEKLHWESSLGNWAKTKKWILDDLSGLMSSASDPGPLAPGSGLLLSRIHDSSAVQHPSKLDHVETNYAGRVASYHESAASGGLKPEVVETFKSPFLEDRDHEAFVLWSMVSTMADLEAPPRRCSPDEAVAHRLSAATAKDIVTRAKNYLEKSFLKHIQISVFSNLRQAQLGGVPGTFPLVKSYLNVKQIHNVQGLEDGHLEAGVPVWAMVYYCLRCGDLDAAVRACEEAGPGLAEMSKLLLEVKSSSDGRLSPHAENVVRITYKRSIRSAMDPYKRAVYCILGACDPADEHGEIATSFDDYLWLKIAQIRPSASDDGDYTMPGLSLEQLQRILTEDYGEDHFKAFEQPVLYFQVLFLTGQFEAAVAFLFRVERFRPHGVHIGLALFEKNLLLLPDTIQSPLLVPDVKAKRLNIVRLVMLYVRRFEVSDPKEALNYFYFLRGMESTNDSTVGTNLFTTCVSELVLESREFDLLLGKILPDGSRISGLIDQYQDDLNGVVNVQKVIRVVAEDSERKGMFEDSARLYDLAKMHEKVIEILNKLLAQVVTKPNVAESRRDRLQRQAVEVAKRYASQGHTVSKESMATFFLLLDLMTFFDAYHASKYDDAIAVAAKLRLVPMARKDIDAMVSTFRILTDEVRRNLPDLLLAAMTILFTNYKALKAPANAHASGGYDGGHAKQMVHLREQAKALITFAGMIPYRMPGDTNARLVQMEVLMN